MSRSMESVVAAEFGDDQASRKHQRAMTEPRDLLEVGRYDDDAEARIESLIEETVDLRLGAHVDAGGRILRNEEAPADAQPAPDDHLLLVAAGERLDRQVRIVRDAARPEAPIARA